MTDLKQFNDVKLHSFMFCCRVVSARDSFLTKNLNKSPINNHEASHNKWHWPVRTTVGPVGILHLHALVYPAAELKCRFSSIIASKGVVSKISRGEFCFHSHCEISESQQPIHMLSYANCLV